LGDGAAEDRRGRDGIFRPADRRPHEPFRSAIRTHLKGHTQGARRSDDRDARGLSVRDIEDAFKDESGRVETAIRYPARIDCDPIDEFGVSERSFCGKRGVIFGPSQESKEMDHGRPHEG
jgi:hypothetical protein